MSHRSSLASLLTLVTLVALAALAAGNAGPAQGASFTVDATHDAVDAAPGDGVCADAGGACTLRAAVMETNTLPGADEISLPAGTYVLTIPTNQGCPDCGPFDASEGDLDIREDIMISGAGLSATIVDGAGLDRVFLVDPQDPMTGEVTAEISDLAVQNGAPHANGGGGVITWGNLTLRRTVVRGNAGGIAVRGELTLIDSTVEGNSDSGIQSQGQLTIIRSTIRDNAGYLGGGISASGQVEIRESTIEGNDGGFAGGGASFTAADVSITNATISGNRADCHGGGLWNVSVQSGEQILPTELTLSSVTFDGNAVNCSGQGGNISTQETSSTTLINTIVSNGGFAGDCFGAVNSLGHNLDSDGTCGLTGPGDLSNVDASLEPLADNGGPTQTHALRRTEIHRGGFDDVIVQDSPATDAGDNASCPAADQRGEPRPFDGSGDGLAVCDIGAYELQQGPMIVPAPTAASTPTPIPPVTLPRTGGGAAPNAIPIAVPTGILLALAVAIGVRITRRVFTHR